MTISSAVCAGCSDDEVFWFLLRQREFGRMSRFPHFSQSEPLVLLLSTSTFDTLL